MAPNSPIPVLPLSLKMRSDPAEIRAVRYAVESFARQSGMGTAATEEIGLCLNEVIANVIRHAYGGRLDQPIVVTAEMISPGMVRVTVRDWGNGVDPRTIPRKPYNPLEPGGVGLICLKEMMDEVVFTPQPDGMLMTLVKREPSGEAGQESQQSAEPSA